MSLETKLAQSAARDGERTPAEKLAAIEALFTAGLDRLPAAVGLAIIRGDAMPAPYPGSA